MAPVTAQAPARDLGDAQPAPAASATARVGIVGAGQLARMTALAAAGLDIPVTVMSSNPDDSAAGVAQHLPGSPDSLDDLRRLAAASEVVTFDHENSPMSHLQALAGDGANVQPRPAAKALAQDKALQRSVLGDRLGLAVPQNKLVDSEADVTEFASEFGWPVVLKARTGGYDGRGVWVADSPEVAREVLGQVSSGDVQLIAERFVEIDAELAVVIARSVNGEAAVYPVVETIQRDGMCREVLAPARIAPAVAAAASELGLRIATEIESTGILAVEMFLSGGELLINELALRPHNSGHLTLGGCVTSQFENHLRAVLGLPLGSVDLVAPAAAMVNVIGPADGSDPRDRLGQALAVPGALIQLYGKDSRPGRKLGHVTVCGPDLEAAHAAAAHAVALLEGREQ